MGTGKAIMGLTLSDIYNSDLVSFMNAIALKFECNLKLWNDVWSDCNIELPEDKIYDFGYPITFSFWVHYYDEDEKHPSAENVYKVYELIVPIISPYEDEIIFQFNPNNIVYLMNLTFESFWSAFVKALSGDNHSNDPIEVDINGYNQLRKAYWGYLSKINCDKLLIFPDNYFGFEDELVYRNPFKKIDSFNEIIQLAKTLDNLIVCDFIIAMHECLRYKTYHAFGVWGEDEFKYVFVDSLNEEGKELITNIEWKE